MLWINPGFDSIDPHCNRIDPDEIWIDPNEIWTDPGTDSFNPETNWIDIEKLRMIPVMWGPMLYTPARFAQKNTVLFSFYEILRNRLKCFFEDTNKGNPM